MDIDEFLTIEEARRETYRLIADFYLQVDAVQLDQVAHLEDLLRIAFPEAMVHLSIMQRETDLDHLEIDHASLFIGPFRLLAPPYGSIYLDNKWKLMGASTIEVRKRYQKLGLDLSKDHLDAPDHIATELEFMHFLIYKELEAIAKGDYEDTLALVQEQKDFLEKHLGSWAPEFTALVEEHASTDFFKGLARVTRAFIQHERQYLAELNLSQLKEVSTKTQSQG